MFGFTGAALSKLRYMQNGGKKPRYSVDQWDRQSTLDHHFLVYAWETAAGNWIEGVDVNGSDLIKEGGAGVLTFARNAETDAVVCGLKAAEVSSLADEKYYSRSRMC